MRPTIAILLLAAGCGGIAVDDEDADTAATEDDQAAEESAEPDDAGEDVADDYDRGEAETTDEDDGWTDPSGEDSDDEAEPEMICEDTCEWLYDDPTSCDDGGPGSSGRACVYGTDCDDCGPRPVLP